VRVELKIADSTLAERTLREVGRELDAARRAHAAMASPHEGHSVIREEFEELWEHVKADTGQSAAARAEAIQLAAMAVRYVVDLCQPRVTHGRHCPCTACKQEDWTKITAPCGMHGPECPAVYAPVEAAA